MRNNYIVTAPLFAAVTAVLSQFAVPLPFSPVPFTFGLLAVFLTGAILKPLTAAVSQIVYLGLGVVGLPVFAGFGGGIGVLVGPTGGYLWSFPLAAFIIALFSSLYKRHRSKRFAFRALTMFAAILPGIAVCYAMGVVQLMIFLGITFDAALAAGVYPFIPLDIIKAGIAAGLVCTFRARLAMFS